MEKAVCSIRDFLPGTGGAGAVVGGVSSVAGLMITHLFGGWSVGLEGLIISGTPVILPLIVPGCCSIRLNFR